MKRAPRLEDAAISSLVPTVSGYVPDLLLTWPGGQGSHESRIERLPGVVLLGDISGFTALTERLAQGGTGSAEQLTDVLNATFGQLIDAVYRLGGDVLKFAGDALLAVWPATVHPDGLAGALNLALQCGLEMQTLMQAPPPGQERLALRVSIGAGDIAIGQVGGERDRWELLIAGDPLAEIAQIEPAGAPGQVLLSADDVPLVATDVVGELVSPLAYRIEGLRRRVAPPPPADRPETAEIEGLWGFVPGAIRSRLEAGQTGWLAEMRQVSVIFVNLPEMGSLASLDRVQEVIRALQRCLYRYEGSLNKLSVDEKGVSVLGAFGLPPLAHEDDALRALQAAADMEQTLRSLGVRGSLGVATGRVFCGEVGNARRREYTVMGDTVNLAARLMQAAHQGILCDEATRLAVRDRWSFEELTPVAFKGKAKVVPVFRPLHVATPKRRRQGDLVGRAAELAAIVPLQDALLAGEPTPLVWLEGEPGIGKSYLVDTLLQAARAKGLACLHGAGDAIERVSPYLAWLPILHGIVLGDVDPRMAQRVAARLESLLDDRPDLWPMRSLLNPLLPIDLPGAEAVADLDATVRAQITRDLLVALIRRHAGMRPTMLVLEDAHWFDSASWHLIAQVVATVPSVMLVVTTRPNLLTMPLELVGTLTGPHTRTVRLGPLEPHDIETVVCARLGVTSLSDELGRFIRERTEGNPFFSEELALTLREAGHLELVEGVLRLAPNADPARMDLPTNLEGIVTSRLDRLPPSPQLLAKVASVIGRSFSLEMLAEVLPLVEDRDRLVEWLEDLMALEILSPDALADAPSYRFRHAITHHVTYHLLVPSQRQALHRAVAEYLEKDPDRRDQLPHLTVLAHHWAQADDVERAFPYLERAGDHALETSAPLEAIACYGQALSMAEGGRLSVGVDTIIRLHDRLGQACFTLGRMKEARHHLEQGLAGLGLPVPDSWAGIGKGLAAEYWAQTVHRWKLPWIRRPQSMPQDQLLLAARLLAFLFGVSMYTNDHVRAGYAALRALNLVEGLPNTAEWALANAEIAALVSHINLKAASYYQTRAEAIVGQIGNLALRSRVLQMLSLFWMNRNDPPRLNRVLEEAISLTERMGDRRVWAECMQILGFKHYQQCDYQQAMTVGKRLAAACERDGDLQMQGSGITVAASALIELGRDDEALTLLEANQRAFESTENPLIPINLQALRCKALHRVGRHSEALTAAWSAADRLECYVPVGDPGLNAHLMVWSTLYELSLTQRELIAGDRERISKLGCRAASILHGTAHGSSLLEALAELVRGQVLSFDGCERKALRAWKRALDRALRHDHPQHLGLVHLELGRHERTPDARRAVHLAEAARCFEAIGSRYELDLVHALQTR